MNDDAFMRRALQEAALAAEKGEVPVGAVLVVRGEVVAQAHNLRELENDPTAHAELLAIRAASARLGSWRLVDAALYVTLEPCIMCMGAALLSRIERIIYGAKDPRGGAAGSLYDLSQDVRLNHRIEIRSGVLEAESGEVLKRFFKQLRQDKKEQRQAK
ncbi:MAG: tRNA adenosine(34) deaminase TadA [Myxococcota bacterium]